MATAKSQRELATALGKSQPAIAKWLKHPRWTLSKTGPWDIAEVKAWAARTLGVANNAKAPAPAAKKQSAAEPRSAIATEDLDPKLRTELFLKTRRAQLLDFELEQLKGKFVPKALVEQERLARIHAVKIALEALPRIAERLVGMSAQQIQTVLVGEVTKILHAFSRQEDAEPQ